MGAGVVPNSRCRNSRRRSMTGAHNLGFAALGTDHFFDSLRRGTRLGGAAIKRFAPHQDRTLLTEVVLV